MSLLIRGVTKLSELGIDVGKDWGGYKIENIGAPDSDDDAARRLFDELAGRWALSQAHRGALNKIMVFKGAGADPVEEDKPVAANFASGSYIGDDVLDRQITTGFLCKLVVVCKVWVSSIYYWIVLNVEGANNICVADTNLVNDYERPYLHATDGFVLGAANITANQATVNYKYVAFGDA